MLRRHSALGVKSGDEGRTRHYQLLPIRSSCATASANSLTVNSIAGDANSFHGVFDVQWDSFGSGGGGWSDNVSGAWDGGSAWRFLFAVSAEGEPPPGGRPREGFLTVTLQSTWLDGWIPGGLGGLTLLTYGFPHANGDDVTVLLNYNRPPLIATDFSGLGLEYYLEADASMTLSYSTDTSGTARVRYNIRRTAVPETGSTLLFLALAVISICSLGRYRFCAK